MLKLLAFESNNHYVVLLAGALGVKFEPSQIDRAVEVCGGHLSLYNDLIKKSSSMGMVVIFRRC